MKIITSTSIKEYVFSIGADLCGIASAEDFSRAPAGSNPKDALPDAKSVIVFAKRFLSGTLKAKSSIPYTIIRNRISSSIDDMSVELAYFLEGENYTALPTGAIEPCNWDEKAGRSRGLISLKHAAELAGLGRIGKNTLLVNEKYGNMIWLGAVITDLELEKDRPITESYCYENCTICIDNCPAQALYGDTLVINQSKCWNYAFSTKRDFIITCFKCRYMCPLSAGIRP